MEYPDALMVGATPLEQRAAGPQLLEVSQPYHKRASIDTLNDAIQDWLYGIGIPAQLHSWDAPSRPHWFGPRRYVSRWSFLGKDIKDVVGTARVIALFQVKFPSGSAHFVREG